MSFAQNMRGQSGMEYQIIQDSCPLRLRTGGHYRSHRRELSKVDRLTGMSDKGGITKYSFVRELVTLNSVNKDGLKKLYDTLHDRLASYEETGLSPETAATLRAENERLRQWVNDLQSGMYVNCVYCGHRYGPESEVPATMAEVLKRHVEQCPEHPMSKLRAENERLYRAFGRIYEKDLTIDEIEKAIDECAKIEETLKSMEIARDRELEPLHSARVTELEAALGEKWRSMKRVVEVATHIKRAGGTITAAVMQELEESVDELEQVNRS